MSALRSNVMSLKDTELSSGEDEEGSRRKSVNEIGGSVEAGESENPGARGNLVYVGDSPELVSHIDFTDSSDDRHRIRYQVVHRLAGRIRLRVSNLKCDAERVCAALSALTGWQGVSGVAINRWCASVVITFDPAVISESDLLARLSALYYGDNSLVVGDAQLKEYRVPFAIGILRGIALLFRGVATFVERVLPVKLQVGLSLAAFASAVLNMPAVLTRVLLAVSIAPIASRAVRVLTDERKIGMDALDGMAASLMLANGNIVEAGFMMALISSAELIRERTARRCEKIVSDLLGLSVRSAWLVRGKKRVCVAAHEVKPDDIVVVYPGDMVPVDGEVIKGEAAIDQSTLTGESMPREVKAGDIVYASTSVVEGKINVRCQASGSQTRAGLVLQCVDSAPIHETRINNYASNLADRVVVPVFLAAGVCFAITRDVGRLMSMLILDFCTGVRIAAPTAILASMHRAGRRGILIKSGAALEQLSTVTAIVFDKTGTLTSGEPKVENVSRFNGHSEDEVLALAAAVEMRLHHPAARAIVKCAQQRGLAIAERSDSTFSRGMGARARVGRHDVIVGSKSMMERQGIVVDEARDSEVKATKLGESISYVAIDGKIAGLIRYRDHLRPEVKSAMAQLKKLGIKELVMATGDTQEAAERIARSCGITKVVARAFPQEKADLVKQLKEQGHVVGVIGDGINDSPALAFADVAISLNGATDAARHTADVVLTDDNLERLPEAVAISRSAMALVKQNLALAVLPNGAGLGMAAFGLLGPAGATILNNGSAMAAALNSLRPLYSNSWSHEETD